MKLALGKIFNRCFNILVCGMLMVSLSQTFVLCKGEDGHVNIEIVNSECCNNRPNGVSHEASATSVKGGFSTTNNCGVCVDNSITIESITDIRKSNIVDSTIHASTINIHTAINSTDFIGYHPVSEPFSPTGYFTPLRSIILLI
jgi:hypothetical protein